MDELTKLSLVEARGKLNAREISAVELAQAYLDEIARRDHEICAYREVYDDVLQQARAADERIASSDAGELLGIPIALKDVIHCKGRRLTAGSKILEGYIASYDASVVAALCCAGAVFLGRTNQDEFAMGSSGEKSAYAVTKNPHDLTRVPGGSTSGSAAAVAGNMALAALGSDTAGSVRQPAGFCGVVGFKSTYGTTSRWGLLPMANSFDQIGPLTKTVADAEIMHKVISGYDPKDATNVPKEKRVHGPLPGKGKRLGVPRSFLSTGIDAAVTGNFEDTLTKLAEKNYEIVEIDLPNLHYSLPIYYVLQPAEVSTNLSRFDGMRFGLSREGRSLLEVYEQTRSVGFGAEPQRRILLGSYVLSAGYYDAYYNKATAVRELIRGDFVRAFRAVDAIVMPSTPSPAFKIGDKGEDALAMYLCDIFTVPGNAVGIPGISVPSGTARVEGKDLPIGFQVLAPWFAEELLFAIGKDVTGEK